MSKDYNSSLNLPQTSFPMKAGLPQREPDTLKYWESIDLYNTMYEMKLFSEDNVGIFRVDIEVERKLTESFRKQPHQIGQVGQIALYCHQRDNVFFTDFTCNKMANCARFRLLVVTLYRTFRHITLDNRNQFFRPFGVNGTSGNRYDAVAVFRIEPHHGVPVLIYADGEL